MKQTSVDWLVNIVERYIENLSEDDLENLSNLFNQAKAMHKEEIKKSWVNGLLSDCLSEENEELYAEYYYDKTFKQLNNPKPLRE